MAAPVKIRLESEFGAKGFQSADAALEKTTRNTKKLAEEGGRAKKALSEGWGDGFKIGLADRALSSLQQIPSMIASGIKEGVLFNATMSDAETAIGNVLQKFGGLSKEAAKREAGAAMQQIIDLEPKAAGSLTDLVGGFMATVASSQAVGISVEENVALVGKFANALANTSLPIEQLAQEMSSILAGNITADSQLAQRLTISNADVAAAKEAGNLYDMLVQKIGQLGEAGDTFAVRWSSFQSAMDKMLGLATKPLFDEFNDGLKTAGELLSNPDLAMKIREMAGATKMLMEAAKDAGGSSGFGVGKALAFGAELPKEMLPEPVRALSVTRFPGLEGAMGELPGLKAISTIMNVLGAVTAPDKTRIAGEQMTSAVGLVDQGRKAQTPEAQAKAREAIEQRIATIKDQVSRGIIEDNGLVQTPLSRAIPPCRSA